MKIYALILYSLDKFSSDTLLGYFDSKDKCYSVIKEIEQNIDIEYQLEEGKDYEINSNELNKKLF